MMQFMRKHPRKLMVLLCLALFAAGYYRERIVESVRVRTLVESAMRADREVQNLISAYDLRNETVKALVIYARKKKIEVSDELMAVFEETAKPDIVNSDALRSYIGQQITLSTWAAELITLMDADLPPTDTEFQRLFKAFQSEEQNLARIRQSYQEQTQTVRALARKGDRQFVTPNIHFPEGRL